MSADLCTAEDRFFFLDRIMPLIRLKAHKEVKRHVRYIESANVAFDELIVEIRGNAHGANAGWTGLSPNALRLSNADSPDNILSEVTRILKGKVPTCAFEYLLSAAEQMRIMAGMRPESVGVLRDGDYGFRSEQKLGAQGALNREFDQSAVLMADKERVKDRRSQVFSNLQEKIRQMEAPSSDPHELIALDGSPLIPRKESSDEGK